MTVMSRLPTPKEHQVQIGRSGPEHGWQGLPLGAMPKLCLGVANSSHASLGERPQ